jgi:tryptophanyl-tRNA synthetase
MAEKIVFSGIQPSGNLHIGNYIGAVQQWVKGQEDGLNIFCIVDMHAITVPQDPKELNNKTKELAALIIAAGVDPEKSILFVQSQNSDHANLGWILNCYVSMGQMSRMTQFKEKSEGKDSVSVGLFDYPALMAADILLYDTTEVPVGDDQKQHVELTRDIAEKFNSKYGNTFTLPKYTLPINGARIMSLSDPSKKMSKSDPITFSRIDLLDESDIVRLKIKKAVTGTSDSYDASNPGVKNLVEIYSNFSGKNIDDINSEFSGKGYKEVKEIIAESLVLGLTRLQERYKNLIESNSLLEILKNGSQKAQDISHKKLQDVYDKVGFVR